MSLLLNVPFSEKDEAKSLGAKWNSQLKKWYADTKTEYHKFRKWFYNKDTDLIICDNIYITVGNHTCFKCQQNIKVISLAASNYVIIDEEAEAFNEDINFISDIENIPLNLQKYLNDNYKYYKGYSKTTKTYYYGNHCSKCGALQGNYFLHSEPDSPFFIDSEECAKDLVIYIIKLKNDLELNGSVGWGSGDFLVKQFATFKDLEIDV